MLYNHVIKGRGKFHMYSYYGRCCEVHLQKWRPNDRSVIGEIFCHVGVGGSIPTVTYIWDAMFCGVAHSILALFPWNIYSHM